MALTTPPSRIGTSWWVAALCGATLALVAGAALGAWNLTLHGPNSGVSLSSSGARRHAERPAAALGGPVASAAVPAGGRSVLVVVDTAVPAVDVSGAVQQMNGVLAANGLPPLSVLALSVNELASPSAIHRALQEMDAVLAANGEPPVMAVGWPALEPMSP